MFGGSVLLFFILAFVDEYENLFIKKTGNEIYTADPYEIEETLNRYVKKLSKAYLAYSPDLIKEIPLSDDLRDELAEEIEFLKNDGRVQEIEVKSIWLQNVSQVAPDKVRATTRESIAVRYLNASDGSEIRSIPAAFFDMSYVLEHREAGWFIIRYDEMGIDDVKKDSP